jgi:dihydrodipicolinate synthase/N-acetylneuraminate lyase
VSTSGKHVYEGIFAAMVTALTAEREVDREGVKRVVNHLLDNGCDGLSILGTTGECNGLRRDQRFEVLDAVLEANDARETKGIIFTGAAGTVATEIVADLTKMDRPGVSAALVPPPFYYALDNQGVIEFYQYVADESPLPIMLYNIPRATKVTISAAALERLAAHPNIMGIKDSSGDYSGFTHFVRIAKSNPGFTVFTGADGTFLGNLMIGAHGIIGGPDNEAPALEKQVFNAFKEGDYTAAADLQRKLAQVVDICKIGPSPAGYKAPLVLRGLCGGYMTHPLQWLKKEQMEKMRTGLAEMGVL